MTDIKDEILIRRCNGIEFDENSIHILSVGLESLYKQGKDLDNTISFELEGLDCDIQIDTNAIEKKLPVVLEEFDKYTIKDLMYRGWCLNGDIRCCYLGCYLDDFEFEHDKLGFVKYDGITFKFHSRGDSVALLKRFFKTFPLRFWDTEQI